jgi:hypothetical protein
VDLKSGGSWNRYSYVQSDPINSADPSGLCDVAIAGITMTQGSSQAFDDYASGMVSAYPFSGGANSDTAYGIFTGVVQGATQALGANSSTVAAIRGAGDCRLGWAADQRYHFQWRRRNVYSCSELVKQ